jgi:hypothetical protein
MANFGANFGRTLRIGVAAALMLAGLTTGAYAQLAIGGGSAFGGESRGVMQIRGNVVCVGCSLDEARKAQPDKHNLVQLGHKQGQVVMEVAWINDSHTWSHIALPQMWVRAEDSLFKKLTAEENLFKQVEITGILSKSRTLDVGKVMILG